MVSSCATTQGTTHRAYSLLGHRIPDTPHLPAPDEAWLRARVAELEELNARLREAAAARDELAAAQLAARDAQIAALAAQVEELLRRLDKDSSTSSKPPSSDSPYKKNSRDRSLRGRSGRRPGKQPGAQSSTLKQSPHPGDTVLCGPAACGCCGRDLAGAPVLGTVQKRQVFEASPPPPPAVTEYQVAAKQCPECGEVSVGLAPAGVTGRVQYGPLVHAKAALAVCANYLPVARAARLVAALTGVNVSAGFVAGVRGKAARLLAPFMNRVRELLPAAPVLYADETPARAAGKLHYVHVACTGFLTAMHTGDRTKEAIDAGGVLPGYAGTIVRDGYKGYEHLTGALHAWCGAHGLRDLAGLYRFDPEGQVWARSMADLLLDANAAATAARSAGQASLSDAGLTGIRSWYRFPVLHPGQECLDLGGRVNQGRPGRIPGVTEGDCPAGNLGYLHATSAGIACPTLAPARHRQLISRDAVRDLHCSSRSRNKDRGERCRSTGEHRRKPAA